MSWFHEFQFLSVACLIRGVLKTHLFLELQNRNDFALAAN